MKRYLLSIYQPDGNGPGPAVLGPVTERLDILNQEIKAAGSWHAQPYSIRTESAC